MRHLLRSPVVLLCATILIAFAALPVAVLSAGHPEPGDVALVIAPPWTANGGAAGIVAAAGGREVGPIRAPFAVLAVFDTQPAARALGAWLILDGRLMAAICGASRADLSGGSHDV
ncbi:hypothetical protein [Jannaschia sp. CCS1]|uniref:hypothetical protein n=1 Tax=Jannaschia sp. (strain CCS1) TaxID=290400 RepID=UPI000053BD80|nr:hypothetical protein [Jannaschia sp. CCS1]ABD55287.1 hypothetical protein Jann_2370 [Jannaschia sp. CCS1]